MSKPKDRKKSNIEEGYKVFFTTSRMLFICFGLAFLFYGNSIKNGYSMDDELVTTTDRQPNELSESGYKGLKKIFTSHSFIDGKQNYEYRPISIYTFALEWSLFGPKENEKFLPDGKPNIGKRPHISHFINVLLYGLVGFVLFQMLSIIFQNQSSLISAAIVILFMIHPIHSEVVNNIKNRDEMLSLLFALLAAIHAFKWIDFKKMNYAIYMLIFILLSLLSKKSNLPFLIMIPMMIYFFRDTHWKSILILFGALLIVKIGFNIEKNMFLSLNQSTVDRFFGYHENPLFTLGFWERIPMYFYSNLFYLQKLFFPYPLSFYYGYNAIPLVGFSDWQFFVSVTVFFSLLAFSIIGIRKKTILSFSILYFFLAIGGASNLLSPIPGIVAERLAFSASVGFCIGLVFLIKYFYPSPFQEKSSLSKTFILPVIIVSIPCFLFAINRNSIWNSKKELYLNDVTHTSESAKVNSLLASEYQLEAMSLQRTNNYKFDVLMEKVDSAILFYDRSLDIYFEYESNLNNKGVMYYMFKYDYIKALNLFKSATKINPTYIEGLTNLGNSYSKIADCFQGINKSIQKIKKTEDTLKKWHSVNLYQDDQIIKSLAIINQFEFNLNDLLNNKNIKNRGQILFANAKQLESLSELLQNDSFSNQMKNLFIGPALNPSLIKAKLGEIRRKIFFHKASNAALKDGLFEFSSYSKEVYIDSARIIYNKIKQIDPLNRSIYNMENQFSILLNDFNWLKETQEEYLLKFKNDFNGPRYIQLGNALRSMNKLEEALKNYKNAQKEFKRELTAIQSKKSKGDLDINRISLVRMELLKLPEFINKLEKEIQLNEKE